MEDYTEKRIEQVQEIRISFEEGMDYLEDLTPLGGTLYRLEATPPPLFVDTGVSLHWGDIIEAEMQENGVLRFKRLVDSSEWQHWDWLLPKNIVESAAFAAFKQTIEEHGGRWEQYFQGIFLIHFPKDSSFDPKACFMDIQSRYAIQA